MHGGSLIATDGVFSMDGYIANLPAICDLAERYGALVMVDDSHAVGFLGAHGRGTPEHRGVGDASTSSPARSARRSAAPAAATRAAGARSSSCCASARAHTCSPTAITPVVAGASLRAIELLSASTELRDRLRAQHRAVPRRSWGPRASRSCPGEHPIVPIMVGDEQLLAADRNGRASRRVCTWSGSRIPVVPLGTARIRTQVSAAHTEDDLRFAADTLTRVAGEVTAHS